MYQPLIGKTAIVTGAAHGIGRAIARHFLDLGAQVMAADQDEAALADACPALREGQPERMRVHAGDLTQRLAMANLLSATLDAFERIDILVNAHRAIQTDDPLATDEDALDRMMRLNVTSGLRLSQMVARRMIAQAEAQAGDAPACAGAIVNVSTLAARRAHPDLLAYSIASAAQEQATRALAVALAPHRIRVNGVCFAGVMSHSLQARLKAEPELRDRLTEVTPLGRLAAPGELAQAVAYLAGEGAGFVTGQILTVDGGRSLIDPTGVPVY